MLDALTRTLAELEQPQLIVTAMPGGGPVMLQLVWGPHESRSSVVGEVRSMLTEVELAAALGELLRRAAAAGPASTQRFRRPPHPTRPRARSCIASQRPLPPPPYPAIRRRNLIYHVHPSQRNDVWKHNVDAVRRRWHRFNGRRVVAVATGEGLEPPAAVAERLGGECEVITAPNCPRLREVATFLPLLHAVADADPHQATFYAHSKGTTPTPRAEAIAHWREGMYAALLDDWGPVAQALTECAFAGAMKMVWPVAARAPYPSAIGRGNWMFSGTFYWFRHDAVFGHPTWRELPDDRYAAEAWPSLLYGPEAGRSLWQLWPETQHPAPSPYDLHHYEAGT